MCLRVLSLAVPLLGIAACGDSNSPAKSIDASTLSQDAPAPPDGPAFKGFMADEGGEVRFEYVNFAAGNAAIRVTNFLYKTAGTPPYNPLPSFSGCTNIDASLGVWPTAQAADRVYMDPGLVLISGGPTTFTGTRNPAAGVDAFNRSHPAGQYTFFFGGSTANDASTYASEKTSFDVTFTGSADMPPITYQNAIWMPASYQLTTPPAGSVVLTAHQDATFTWTAPEQDNPPDHEIYDLVGFTGPNGPSVICAYPKSASMTVPAAMVDIVLAKYPNGGSMVRQEFSHVVHELVDNNGPTGRRIDFIGVWCNASPFTTAM